jgi:ATP-dependent Clp protease protease subunit
MQFATQSLDAMLKRRCVPLRGPVTERCATECIAQLLFLASQHPQKPLTLCVDSVGGLVAESIAIIRTIDDLSCPVATFCHGEAAGTAAIIVAHGCKGARVAVPGARFAFAPVFADHRQGYVEAQLSQFPQALVEILSEDARKHETELLGWFRDSIEFVAEQALALGLIDSVSAEPASLRGA